MTLRVQFKSVADRDVFLRAGVKEGMGQSLDRFERVLRTLDK